MVMLGSDMFNANLQRAVSKCRKSRVTPTRPRSNRRLRVEELPGDANSIASSMFPITQETMLASYQRVESDDIWKRDVVTDQGIGKYVSGDGGSDGGEDA